MKTTLKKFCYNFVTSLKYNLLNTFLAGNVLGEGVAVVEKLKNYRGNEAAKLHFPFFYEFFEIFADLYIFCYIYIEKQGSILINRVVNPVTKCNKIQKRADFVTFCYTLLRVDKKCQKILLHFVHSYQPQLQLINECNKCNRFSLAAKFHNITTSHFDFIKDKKGCSMNLVTGSHLQAGNRFFEITGVWFLGTEKQVYELTEYFFPSGWQRMLREDPEKLSLMKNTYPQKTTEVLTGVIHDQIVSGKMWYY